MILGSIGAATAVSTGRLQYIPFKPEKYIKIAGQIMFIGIILFSGSIYTLSTTIIRWVGLITPVGGIAFIVSWAFITITV